MCTGALLLGAAGVLDGLDATTHWFAYDELAALRRPAHRAAGRRCEGKVVTAAGVSAGIDLALTLVAEIWTAPRSPQAVQLGIEYDPQPPVRHRRPSKARPEIKALVEAVQGEAEKALLA